MALECVTLQPLLDDKERNNERYSSSTVKKIYFKNVFKISLRQRLLYAVPAWAAHTVLVSLYNEDQLFLFVRNHLSLQSLHIKTALNSNCLTKTHCDFETVLTGRLQIFVKPHPVSSW